MTDWLPETAARAEEQLQRWRLVARLADDFFDNVARSHGDQMACQPGCTECCHPALSVVRVEALAILLALSRLTDAERAPLRAAAADAGRARCPLLGPDLRCAVYPLRPLICRTHGLPVLQDEGVSLCSLNFADGIPEDAVLDGTVLAAQLGVVDAMIGGGPRVLIAELVLEGAAALARR